MNTKKVAEEYRLTKWAGIIQEKKNSGKNIKDFCRDAGINTHSYFYYQRKLRTTACGELMGDSKPSDPVPSVWMQLVSEKKSKEALNIEVGGCCINVNEETDFELLKQICRLLRSL